KSRGRIGLGAGDLRRDPERAIHALTDHQMSRFVHDGDGDFEAQLLSALHAALDAGARQIAGDAAHEISTETSSFSTRTAYDGTAAPRPGNTHCPVRTSYIQPCHGHARRVPDSFPSLRGPPRCTQTSLSAWTRSPIRTRTTRLPSASTSRGTPGVSSASPRRTSVTSLLCSPQTAGPQPRDVLRLALHLLCSPQTAGPQPRDVLRLALHLLCSPQTAGPQPRDVLRLALHLLFQDVRAVQTAHVLPAHLRCLPHLL